MAIPIATTTITVRGRAQSLNDPDAEGYDPAPPAPATKATGVRASITLPSPVPNEPQQTDIYALRCDDVEGMERFDTVIDESDDVEYELMTLTRSKPTGFGLEHTIGTLRLVKGVSNVGR